MAWNDGRPRGFPPTPKSGPFRNPHGTIPSPHPSELPAGQWTDPLRVLRFTDTGLPDTVSHRAIWSTPVFDLRPDLGTSQGQVAGHLRPGAGVCQVWRASGLNAGAKLFFWINNINVAGLGLRGMRVYTREFAHPTDPYKVLSSQITGDQDVTSQLLPYEGQTSAILQAYPTGDGYPVRYWRISVYFDIMKEETYVQAPPTNLQCQGALY